MSRLESHIRRLIAQHYGLNYVASLLPKKHPLTLLEMGLGNGRTYDHLRYLFPQDTIYVFDIDVHAHPDSIPPESYMIKGDFFDTIPPFSQKFSQQIDFIHSDIGSADAQQTRMLIQFITPFYERLLNKNGLLLSDQPITANNLALQTLPLPEPNPYQVQAHRYFLYKRC